MNRTIFLLLLLIVFSPLFGQDLEDRVAEDLGELTEIYRHLHSHPELSYQERETATFLATQLRNLGFEVTEKVGDYGVEGRVSYGLVGVLRNGQGPTVWLRTDLDGLPVVEETGLAYASRVKTTGEGGDEVGVMHACGHDLHMTSFLGAARLLSRLREEWRGTLVMIGQPAEERGAGARAMLADGLYRRFPRPEFMVALHSDSALEAGKIGFVSGYALANVDSVDILVKGEGGHGAYPHTTKDPVTLAAQIIVNLQTLVSRQVSPLDPAVVTVGSIHGGTKHNIIPNEVRLQLTVRSYRPEVRQQLLDGIRRIAVETARAAGFPEDLLPDVGIKEEEYTPSTFNDPDLVNRLVPVFKEALGDGRVVPKQPVMGGEDFSRYALEGQIPTALFWLGTVEPEKVEEYARRGIPLPSLHSSRFAPQAAPAIQTGVAALVSAVLELASTEE